jgi:L-fuculose-phosphate aldolase
MCSATSWAASSGSFCFDRVHDLLMLNIELGAAMFGGPVRGAAPHATFGTAELAEGVVAALRKRTAALMGNHGALTVGATLAVACQRVPYREYVCEVHLRALSIVLSGRTLPPEEVALVAEQLSSYGERAPQN